MSIDIDLAIDTGNGLANVVYVGNYTHNCQPMWTKALNSSELALEFKEYWGDRNVLTLCHTNGILAESIIPLLKESVAHMENNREEYEKLNPDNGWGDYFGALQFLRDLLTACELHPKCTVVTSC